MKFTVSIEHPPKGVSDLAVGLFIAVASNKILKMTYGHRVEAVVSSPRLRASQLKYRPATTKNTEVSDAGPLTPELKPKREDRLADIKHDASMEHGEDAAS